MLLRKSGLILSNANKEELYSRVKEILLEFGECALEKVVLHGKTICVYDNENLERDGDHYILAYNRFENDTWEMAYMKASLEEFDGVRSRAINLFF